MRLTITEISRPEYKGKAIWVLNKTAGKERGPVIFNCNKLNGQGVDSVYVPDTFIPINVIEHITWDRLTESVPFRQAVNRGLLHIIDETEAREIMALDGVAEEIERLRTQEGAFASVSTVEGVEIPEDNRSDVDIESGLPVSILGIITRSEEQGEQAVINSLRSHVDDLTQEHLKCIFMYAKRRGYKRIMKWAKEQRDA